MAQWNPFETNLIWQLFNGCSLSLEIFVQRGVSTFHMENSPSQLNTVHARIRDQFASTERINNTCVVDEIKQICDFDKFPTILVVGSVYLKFFWNSWHIFRQGHDPHHIIWLIVVSISKIDLSSFCWQLINKVRCIQKWNEIEWFLSDVIETRTHQ